MKTCTTVLLVLSICVAAGVILGLVLGLVFGRQQEIRSTRETSTPHTTPQESTLSTFTSTPVPVVPIHVGVVRLDCHPDPDANQDSCKRRGCLWNSTISAGEPSCFYPTNYGYVVKDATSRQHITIQKRTLADEIEWISQPVPVVDMTWEYYDGGIAHVKFLDPSKQRYEVPLELWPEGKPETIDSSRSTLDVLVPRVAGNFFTFEVKDKTYSRILFDTSLGGFVYDEQFLQISTYLPSYNLYGFGENIHQSFRHNLMEYKTWPMFARDQFPWSETPSRANLYGVHPFYMGIEQNGHSFGVFFLNSNAQEYTTGPGPFLTYRTIGGILDIYFFPGPSPSDVIAQYWKLIGGPMMPAYWSLGFQLCRYGYNDTQEVINTVERMRNHSIPQDVQYVDIDYMDKRKDFTIDPVRFGDLDKFVQESQKRGLRWIFIVDPAIDAVAQNYTPFSQGKDAHAFVTWPNQSMVPAVNERYDSTKGTTLMLGTEWPYNSVVYPNFLSSATRKWWKKTIVDFRSKLKFDGLWIDMNEPSNFGTNEKDPWYLTDPKLKDIPPLMCPASQYDDPPYATQAAYFYGKDAKLSSKTICMIGKQGPYLHYDVHSIYGWSQGSPTLAGVRRATGERGVVLCRSTYPSSGRYVGHWLGDNYSKWTDMKTSIIGIMEFNMFGIPYVGADICGFQLNTTEELCARWQQLGSFYPFTRNHNDINRMLQDPTQWPTVASAARASLNNRYSFMPYLYTLYYQAHRNSEMVVQPLFFQFPDDTKTFNIDRQFLWGPALIITPVLEEGTNNVTGYFPKGIWYNVYQEENYGKVLKWGFHTVTSEMSESVPLHLRGGYSLPTQKPELNTVETRRNPLKLLIALDENGTSNGELYWDDGVSIDPTECHVLLQFSFSVKTDSWLLLVELMKGGGCAHLRVPPLSELDILGVDDLGKITAVRVGTHRLLVNSSYNNVARRLTIRFLNKVLLNLDPAKKSVLLHWQRENATQVIPEGERVDCHPGPSANKLKCLALGCIWNDTATVIRNAPHCYYPRDYGYVVVSKTDSTVNSVSLSKVLQATEIEWISEPAWNVRFDYEYFDDDVVHLKFTDPSRARYEVPIKLWPYGKPRSSSRSQQLQVVVAKEGEIFWFKIVDQMLNRTLFDTSIGGFVFEDQFLQISTFLPSFNLYGFGENEHEHLKHNLSAFETWPMFARDQRPAYPTRANLYGVHPFYLCLENTGTSFGVFFLNSNAQEYTTAPAPSVTYRTIGGILDIYVFRGPSPANVISQYWQLIGRPTLVPYWSLGFQLSRYGYENTSQIKQVVEEMRQKLIPQDVQYADIDYMAENKDFTLSEPNFSDLPAFVNESKQSGLRWIFILDPAINAVVRKYTPFTDGKRQNVFIKWPNRSMVPPVNSMYANTNGTLYMLGTVWPYNSVAFPNFLSNVTATWWKEQAVRFHSLLPYDGLWIGKHCVKAYYMNEPANFGTNEKEPWYLSDPNLKDIPPLMCPKNQYDDPPYATQAAYVWGKDARLSQKTLCMIGKQGEYLHYDVHNIYGWSEGLPTIQAVQEATKQRGIVLCRSTYPSSGRYVGHWLGDNTASWGDMRRSVVGMLEFSMFGIPYVGADICGFNGNTTEELCARWQQLGSFYPFSRNHNGRGQISQEPTRWATVAEATRNSLNLRYAYLPYLYTLFYEANAFGLLVIRPMFYEFPHDSNTYSLDRQFMVGPALMVVPVLTEGEVSTLGYFENGERWYNVYQEGKIGSVYDSQWAVVVDIIEDSVPVFVRGGFVLPRQKPELTTTESRKNPLELLIAPSSDGTAVGSLYWDDGSALVSSTCYAYLTFSFVAVEQPQASRNLTVLAKKKPKCPTSSLVIPPLKAIDVFDVNYAFSIIYLKVGERKFFVKEQQYDSENKREQIFLNEAIDLNGLDEGQALSIIWSSGNSYAIELTDRVNCDPRETVTGESCEQLGCIWNTTVNAIDAPWCYYPKMYGYVVQAKETRHDASVVLLQKKKLATEVSSISATVQKLLMETEFYDDKIVHVKFTDRHSARYEVPIKLWPEGKPQPKGSSTNLKVDVTGVDDFFTFTVKDYSPGRLPRTLFDTSISGFVFNDQFLQVATYLHSDNLYGFGENVHSSIRHDLSSFQTWPMFARDQPPWSKEINGENLYGVHPFYMCVDKHGASYGVLFLNSDPQEYTTTPAPAVIYTTIGGILDIYIFSGPSPAEVISQYWKLIGKPIMVPYWSLGFQLSRYGYKNTEDIKDVVSAMRQLRIPQDVQYADIDYMAENKDFTVDIKNFGTLPDYVKKSKKSGLRWIFILEPAINAVVQNYAPFIEGKQLDVFVTWPNASWVPKTNGMYDNTNGTLFMLGTVWPYNSVVFPNFLNETTADWWQKQVVDFYSTLQYDGLWIDMNEPANFGTNEELPWYITNPHLADIPPLMCPQNQFDDPPYATKAATLYDVPYGPKHRLSDKTLCMIGRQGVYRHYDVHSIYGWSEGLPTLRAIQQATNERGVVLCRSTYPSSGRFVGHWLGDNNAEWEDMRTSVIGMMEFTMFGIPYVGADICGFSGNTTEELCARWHQLGAFYPMSRNHNSDDTIAQDPSQWNMVASAARASLNLRYTYLPYLYTLFYKANKYAEMVAQPLFFQFPTDEETLDKDEQFLIGPALLITPVLYENEASATGYFPEGVWYNIYEDEFFGKAYHKGYHHVEVALNGSVGVHVRGGYILPRQPPGLNTKESRLHPMQLLIAAHMNLSEPHKGDLHWDDGQSQRLDTHFADLAFEMVKIEQQFRLTITMITKVSCCLDPTTAIPKLDMVEILGIPCNDNATVEDKSHREVPVTVECQPKLNRLRITFTQPFDLNKLKENEALDLFLTGLNK